MGEKKRPIGLIVINIFVGLIGIILLMLALSALINLGVNLNYIPSEDVIIRILKLVLFFLLSGVFLITAYGLWQFNERARKATIFIVAVVVIFQLLVMIKTVPAQAPIWLILVGVLIWVAIFAVILRYLSKNHIRALFTSKEN